MVSVLFSGVSVYGDEKSSIEKTDSEKMEIANKVVNSIDYFDRVTITFRERYGNLSDREYQVKAKMDFTKGLLDEEFVEKFDDGTIGEQKATLYDKSQDKNLLDINFKEKDYVASQYDYDSTQGNRLIESYPIEKRITSVGENVLFQKNSTLPLSMSADAVFPQTYGAQFFSDFDNWDLVGEDTLLGRQAIVAEGNYPKELGEKLKADRFK